MGKREGEGEGGWRRGVATNTVHDCSTRGVSRFLVSLSLLALNFGWCPLCRPPTPISLTNATMVVMCQNNHLFCGKHITPTKAMLQSLLPQCQARPFQPCFGSLSQSLHFEIFQNLEIPELWAMRYVQLLLVVLVIPFCFLEGYHRHLTVPFPVFS